MFTGGPPPLPSSIIESDRKSFMNENKQTFFTHLLHASYHHYLTISLDLSSSAQDCQISAYLNHPDRKLSS